MSARVLTEVSATVLPEREAELVARFQKLLAGPVPDGLLRTELLRGPSHTWRIQTLWRDRGALEAMRAQGQPPAAPSLFREVGADPVLAIFQVEGDHLADVDG